MPQKAPLCKSRGVFFFKEKRRKKSEEIKQKRKLSPFGGPPERMFIRGDVSASGGEGGGRKLIIK
jgi:hypothetical protein